MTKVCYVCGGTTFVKIIKKRPSMSSDGGTVDFTLEKEECSSCGVVRSSNTDFLENFYKTAYQLNTSNIDPLYVYQGVGMPKSRMHWEWISGIAGDRMSSCKSMIEIGCGSGNLLALFPVEKKFGVEPSESAARFASQVADVRSVGYEDIDDSEKYDLILSSCVIEHTVDPSDFLKKVHSIAHKDSLIIIGLPVQDTESFDIYFLDHLHHFSSGQFIQMCRRNGFEVLDHQVGYKCMTTLGYFILKKEEERTVNAAVPATTFEKNRNIETFERLLSSIDNFVNDQKQKIVAFGYGETSFFFQTYTNINSIVEYYIDDVRANGSNVLTVNDAIQKGVLENKCMILLANPHYHSFIKEKFSAVNGLKYFSPFVDQLTAS